MLLKICHVYIIVGGILFHNTISLGSVGETSSGEANGSSVFSKRLFFQSDLFPAVSVVIARWVDCSGDTFQTNCLETDPQPAGGYHTSLMQIYLVLGRFICEHFLYLFRTFVFSYQPGSIVQRRKLINSVKRK